MTIIVSRSGRNATRLAKTGVASEDYLQQYIYQNPECLPLDEYKEDVRLLILVREFPTGSGPIDALGVDADGEIYLIETKLYKNPDKRLVLAQVLDYGASLWRTYADPEEFIVQLQRTASRVGGSLSERLSSAFGSVAWDEDQYLSQLRTNVAAGTFRLVVLMDRLDERLKDLIAFMNQNCRFDILGVELEFYQHEDLEILIPRLFGAETKKTLGSSGSGQRRKWDEQQFLHDLASRVDGHHLERVRELLAWGQANAQISWGTGIQRGSFSFKFPAVGSRSVLSVFSDGTLQLNFGWLDGPEYGMETGQAFGNFLRAEIPELQVPENYMNVYVSVPIEVWSPHVSDIVRVLEKVIKPNSEGD